MGARLLTVANAKGGVGKTSVAVNLAAALAEVGERVLVVDFDPQGSATLHFGLSPESEELRDRTVFQWLLGEASAEVCLRSPLPGVDLLPSNLDLSGAEIALIEEGLPQGAQVLGGRLSALRPQYDRILIDTPPTFGILTLNALAAADEVLIPVACDYLSLRALLHELVLLERVRERYNPGLRVAGILATFFDARTTMAATALQELRRTMDGRQRVFETVIRQAVAFREASAAGEPLLRYAPHHPGAQAFRQLVEEIQRRGLDEARTG